MDVLREGHEQVVFCSDGASGLRAVIAIYSTALGPALGGTRFFPYASEEAAVDDALALSRAMAYKNSLAGLDLGGGKAVIIGDPRTDKTEALLRAYGRFVQSLGGRYLTACDVGTTNADLDLVARETRYAHGRSEAYGGCGDSSVLTAFGVFQGMRAAAQHVWGSASLAGRTVAVSGVGKVGSWLVDHLVEEGADVVITDVDPAAVARVQNRHPAGARRRRHRGTRADTARHLRALRAGRRPRRRDRGGPARTDRLRRRQQPARRAPTSPSSWSPAASSTRPTTWSTPAASSRSRTSDTGSPSSGPAPGPPASSTSPCGCSGPRTTRASRRPWPPIAWPRSA